MKEPAPIQKRFWCPREGSINLADGGFLVDPEAERGSFYHSDVVPFESIAGGPCLCLLGEPGIGKTTALKSDLAELKRSLKEPDKCSFIDLRAYQTDIRLHQAVFESYEYLSWLGGTHRLHLFLDSLDECLIRIGNVSAVLLEGFQQAPPDRLFLRITCRTADWQNTLESGLRAIWGDKRVGVFELAPLRRIDVLEAARQAELKDAESFVSEVVRREAVPLAIKPITLKFLLNSYSREGTFPPTRSVLYEQGCLLLCEETSESRRDAKLVGDLTAESRLAIASRIAAITTFANRYGIWTGPDLGDVPLEDIRIQDFVSGTEPAVEHVSVTQQSLRETLDTGLFSSRGSNRLGWAHQTYAEFLAARYLVKHKFSVGQMLAFVMHPNDPGRVVPQLHETAAWLAGMIPEVFRRIMETDTEMLLRSDVAAADPTDRRALVQELLFLYDQGKLLDSRWDANVRYDKLRYPEMHADLRPYIVDRSRGIVVRLIAMDFARENRVLSLQDELLDVALDTSDSYAARIRSAHTISEIGEEWAKAKLKPLALGLAGDDPDDELKACGLDCVWPAHLTAAELFSALAPPKRPDLIGLYQRFVQTHVAEQLRPDDLPRALEWAVNQAGVESGFHPFGELVDKLTAKALDHLDTADVVERLALVARKRLQFIGHLEGRYSRSGPAQRLHEDTAKRRALLVAMLPLYASEDSGEFFLLQSRLVMAEDVAWLIEQLEASRSETIQLILARLIARCLVPADVEMIDRVLIAARRTDALGRQLAWLLEPVELGSPQAVEMKEWQAKERAWQKGPPALDPPPQVRISELLDSFESGKTDAFWRLNYDLTLEPNSTTYGSPFPVDFTMLPGWGASDGRTKARIIGAAKRYLFEGDPGTAEWLGTNQIRSSAIAGYWALRLLQQIEPSYLETLPPGIWETWSPTIFTYFSQPTDDQEALCKLAYEKAPEAVVSALRAVMEHENRAEGRISVANRIKGFLGARLEEFLLESLQDPNFTVASIETMLGVLMKNGSAKAAKEARDNVESYRPGSGEAAAKAVIAAVQLVNYASDAGWGSVWPAVQRDREFGLKVFSGVAWGSEAHEAQVAKRLTDVQLGNLYIWLARNVPYSGDVMAQGVIGAREHLRWWRDGILGHLKGRGTQAACDQIRRAMVELPELDWLKWHLVDAETLLRRSSWVPLAPQEILKVAADTRIRLVRNSEHLLQVLVESLRRLQERLQGETPAVIDLWNKIQDGVFKPKDEMDFSNYIKRHLKQDIKEKGIIFNREVEIRRGTGGGPGERTDIHVNAITSGGSSERFDTATVIIEVKGCWNRDLFKDMKGQLVERYLRDNPCKHGLYVVGWFSCSQWDPQDRKGLHSHESIEQVQNRLDEQAAELSGGNVMVKALVLNCALR